MPICKEHFISDLTMLELDVQLIQNVWVPDLYMPAEKKATLHEVTVPNKLMHIYSDGKIQYSMRCGILALEQRYLQHHTCLN